ncbi:MAG: DMT family transporter [Candidatus Hodarchaeales archaeon]|jgi:uncharacterized membrane protein
MDFELLIPMLIALTGSFTLNIGFVLQKSQVKLLPSFKEVQLIKAIKGILKCRKWVLGTLFTSIGWILFLIAISIAPLTVIAPLNNVGIIVLALVAITYLNEKLALFEWIGFAMILIGVIIIPIYAPSTLEGTNSTEDILLLILTGIVVFSFIMFKLLQGLWFPSKSGVVLGSIAGVTGGLGAVYTKVASQLYPDLTMVILMIITMLMFQAISFVTLQNSFQKERATIIVPLFNSFSTLIPLIFGMVVFRESIPTGQLLGILLVVIGASTMFRYSEVDISAKQSLFEN